MKIKTITLMVLIILFILSNHFFSIFYFNAISEKLTEAILNDNKDEIFSSIESLKRIAQQNARDVLVYRRLAQAYLAVGNEEEAIKSLLIARNLSPESIIIQRELGLAYILAGQPRVGLRILSNISNSPESLSGLIESILEEQIDKGNYELVYSLLEALDIAFNDAEQTANKAIEQGDGRKAFYWLLAAQILDPELKRTLSLRKVAAIYMSDIERKNITEEDMLEIPIHRQLSGNRVSINGGDLLWMRDVKEWGVSFGSPASTRSSEPDVGVMWWNGRVVAFVEIVKEGQYRLRLQIKQSTPPPIVVDVFINQNKLFRINLSRGDNTWAYVDSLVHLSLGVHMISIAFVNNDIVNGSDRNVYINKVSLESN
ncbi:hypothetical protein [Chloroflexus sp.]|jgi:tetratricopeptide (TPR) repeat protein|uniref:tetratricopeptide repeat protein n=1 Tax=Chloroflexus sp. TaxID=1904827 RepID=UPI000F1B01D7|nr:hypothetical protein [Chloroflexus sp.]RMG47442.1 MAG: hypothetical protein D6716_15475 [Chloroflexota bacterium]